MTDARTGTHSAEVGQQGASDARTGRHSTEVAQQGAAAARVGTALVEVAIVPDPQALLATHSTEVAQQGVSDVRVGTTVVEVAQVVAQVDEFPATGYPGLSIQIAFGYTWRDESPVWTDVTTTVDREAGVTISTGRADELSPFDAGTCTFRLDNRLRTYDPLYAAGPYYTQLEPIVPVRVLSTFDEISHPMFYGYIEGWPQESRVGDNESWTDITANDALELFAQTDYSGRVWTLDDATLGRLDSGNRIGGGGSLVSSYSGERVEIILDLVGHPLALRDIDTGRAELADDPIDGSPRTALQTIEEAEAGWLYVDTEGRVVFLGRNAERSLDRMALTQATFSDQDLVNPYAGLRFAYDRKYVYNDVRRERTGGESQVATDEDSIDRYFARKHEITDLPLTSDSDTMALAQQFLSRYALPALRPLPMVVDPNNNPAVQFPQVMIRQLLDRITITRTPQQIGDPIVADYRIEGITHNIGASRWLTTWTLSPVDTRTFWTLDNPVLGLLDSGNLVGA